ncbi:hypothetical protein L6164_031034 [Bauhinia variegata]|uniref:Uncharacterized protein n=1 Tax=Bauhinia variegata TaxID=167791 RepID=A0ACB9LE27_BAUVA|nr:hypothetical protein L6164_031034 [Bauhinia variegata]
MKFRGGATGQFRSPTTSFFDSDLQPSKQIQKRNLVIGAAYISRVLIALSCKLAIELRLQSVLYRLVKNHIFVHYD